MRDSLQLATIHYGIIALTLFTAVVHFSLGNVIFLLNGLGYLVLLILVLWPKLSRWHRPARWAMVGYTTVTVVSYFIAHSDGSWQTDGLGLMTKLVEVILILLLIYEMQLPLDSSVDPEI